MPSKIHGGVSQQFSRIFDYKARGMGMPPFNFSWIGDSRFKGRMREKEADNCFFPLTLADIEIVIVINRDARRCQAAREH